MFFGLPDGGLEAPVPYEGAQGHALALGDLDGDGWPDVVVSNLNAPGINVFLNDGAGGLRSNGPLATALPVHGIGIGDLNNDGFVDLALSEAGDGGASLELAVGKAGGAFSGPRPLPQVGGTFLGGLVVADLNGDGMADMACNTSDGAQLAVLLNQGDGGFQLSLYSPAVLGQLALLPNAAGVPDLLLGNANPKAFLDGGPTASGTIQVLRNSGRGTFSLGSSYQAPGGLTLAVGDFNGDCIPDIATSSFGAPPATWGISVLYGDGDGGFEQAVSLQATSQTPGFLAPMGLVDNPRALAVGSTGLTIYGDASKR